MCACSLRIKRRSDLDPHADAGRTSIKYFAVDILQWKLLSLLLHDPPGRKARRIKKLLLLSLPTLPHSARARPLPPSLLPFPPPPPHFLTQPAHQNQPFAPIQVIATYHASSCPELNGMLPPTHPSLPSARLPLRALRVRTEKAYAHRLSGSLPLLLCLKRQPTLPSIYPCQRVQRSTIQISNAVSQPRRGKDEARACWDVLAELMDQVALAGRRDGRYRARAQEAASGV